MEAISQLEHWQNVENRRSPYHPAVEAFSMPKISEVVKTTGMSIDTKVLDVGCGNGYLTLYLSKVADVTGIDLSEKMLSLNPCNKLVHGNALNLPFGNNSFDIALEANLLHHLDNPKKAVDEMTRVSKEWVVLIEPNPKNIAMSLFLTSHKAERMALQRTLQKILLLCIYCHLDIRKVITSGFVAPRLTPKWLVPILTKLDKLGSLYHLIIARKGEG